MTTELEAYFIFLLLLTLWLSKFRRNKLHQHFFSKSHFTYLCVINYKNSSPMTHLVHVFRQAVNEVQCL